MNQDQAQKQAQSPLIKKQSNSSKNLSQRKLRSIKSQKYLTHSQVQIMNQHTHQINNRFVQIRVLTKQKDQLISQLNALRQGAVTALQEKQQIIDKLRNFNQRQVYFQDQKQQMQKQLSKCQRRIKDLHQERKEIEQKCEKQRAFFFQQIYNKEAIIDQLSSRIAHMQVDFDALKQENMKINRLIFQYEQNIEKTHQQINDLRSQMLRYNKKLSPSPGKQINSIPQRNNSEILFDDNILNKENQQDQQKIQKLKQFYQKQIENITTFYERQLKLMRSVFQKQIGQNTNLKKTNQTQIFSDQQENDSICQLLSLKSGLRLKQTSNLKNQLKRQSKADQQQSQFTSKYFSYEPKPLSPSKYSVQSTQKSLKQEQKIIEQVQQQPKQKEKQKKRINKRQIIFCVGGGIVGMVMGAAIMKSFRHI